MSSRFLGKYRIVSSNHTTAAIGGFTLVGEDETYERGQDSLLISACCGRRRLQRLVAGRVLPFFDGEGR